MKIMSCRLLPMTFGLKRSKMDDFRKILCIVVYISMKSCILDSKSHRRINENKSFVSFQSNSGIEYLEFKDKRS